MKEKKRNGHILVSVIVALSILAGGLLAGLLVVGKTASMRKNDLDALYSRAYYDMCDSVNNMEINLSKLMIASSKKESLSIINEVGAQAEIACNSISSLPLSPNEIANTEKYFNQVADWSRSYASAVVGGKSVGEFQDQAENLYVVSRSLNASLKELSQNLDGKCIGDCVGKNRLLTLDFANAFTEMETNSIEYPELIYDGPFSDAKKHCWHAIENMSEISVEQAMDIARKKLGLDNVSFSGETHGKAVIYELDGSINRESVHISITKKGGIISSFNRDKKVDVVNISKEKAIAIALEKVSPLGYDKNLDSVWYNSENGVALINLAPKLNGVIIYPDLIKIKIALDDGTLLGVESTGYCASHHERNLTATITENTARSLAPKKLAIQKITLAVIPADNSDNEYLCYEIAGEYKGLSYFVYVDAYDGTQRDVLRVIDSEQGEMVM